MLNAIYLDFDFRLKHDMFSYIHPSIIYIQIYKIFTNHSYIDYGHLKDLALDF